MPKASWRSWSPAFCPDCAKGGLFTACTTEGCEGKCIADYQRRSAARAAKRAAKRASTTKVVA